MTYEALADYDEDAPLRHAYLLDDQGQALLFYLGGVSLGPDPADVLADCEQLFGP